MGKYEQWATDLYYLSVLPSVQAAEAAVFPGMC